MKEDIQSYIASYPKEAQPHLKAMRAAIRKAAPAADETISYGIPTFRIGERNLVHFGGAKKHVGFYPSPSGIEAFRKELGSYKTSKGAVQFPLEENLPVGLIAKIVKFRIKEEKERAQKR